MPIPAAGTTVAITVEPEGGSRAADQHADRDDGPAGHLTLWSSCRAARKPPAECLAFNYCWLRLLRTEQPTEETPCRP